LMEFFFRWTRKKREQFLQVLVTQSHFRFASHLASLRLAEHNSLLPSRYVPD
jgi:hypothetical protein